MRVAYIVLIFATALLLTACASSGGQTLRIDARHVPGMQHVPDELTSMLQDLGYGWVHILDPESHRGVKVIQKDGEYRMQFEFLESRQARINVRVRRQDGFTWLHFYEPDSQTLSPSSTELLHKLQERTVQEFGAANVSY